jgi:cardiolipin synthase
MEFPTISSFWPILASIAYVLSILICITALFVVPVNRKPSSATAWLMLIFLIPFIGALIFAIFGSPKLTRHRRAKQQQMDELLRQAMIAIEDGSKRLKFLSPTLSSRYRPFVQLNANLTHMPAFGGNRVELLDNYQGAVDSLVAAIDAAQRYVHVEFYIFADDETGGRVVDALIRAQQRGVVCRVLTDHIGNSSDNKALLRRLSAHGISAHVMLPVRLFDNEWSRFDLRNHRKLAVIDGLVGFTGSQNLINDDYNKRANKRRGLHYVELMARLEGPIVHQLNAVFITDWYSETDVLLAPENAPEMFPMHISNPEDDVICQVLPSGPAYDNDNNLKLFVSLFHAAQHSITIANPYVVPDDAIMTALTSAAQRGVTVKLIVSEIGDQFLVYHAQRSYYEELLRAGVEIHQYRSPTLLHSKFLCIDDDIGVIGSSNMDMRSFQLNLEVSLVCYDKGVVAQMNEVLKEYLAESTQLTLEQWEQRSRFVLLFDNLARLTAALQ